MNTHACMHQFMFFLRACCCSIETLEEEQPRAIASLHEVQPSLAFCEVYNDIEALARQVPCSSFRGSAATDQLHISKVSKLIHIDTLVVSERC